MAATFCDVSDLAERQRQGGRRGAGVGASLSAHAFVRKMDSQSQMTVCKCGAVDWGMANQGRYAALQQEQSLEMAAFISQATRSLRAASLEFR